MRPEAFLRTNAGGARGGIEFAERGYVVRRNVAIERRWTRGEYDRLGELANELVRFNPTLILNV
jgi:hypothetical protein